MYKNFSYAFWVNRRGKNFEPLGMTELCTIMTNIASVSVVLIQLFLTKSSHYATQIKKDPKYKINSFKLLSERPGL